MSEHASVAAMWAACKAARHPPEPTTSPEYCAWHFGHTAQLANSLAALVANGRKCATASARWSYELEGMSLPVVCEWFERVFP